ncbi:MAG: hypothetical protein ACRYG5_19270 [Janthinobacterium lividum]
MPFLLLPVVALVAIIAAGVYFFHSLSAALGVGPAIAIIVLVVVLIIGIPIVIWRRRRLPGQESGQPGRYTFRSASDKLVVDARQRLVTWRLDGARQPTTSPPSAQECLFADLRGAQASQQGEAWLLSFQVPSGTVQVPMPNARAAHQWQRVLQLAMAQQLPG